MNRTCTLLSVCGPIPSLLGTQGINPGSQHYRQSHSLQPVHCSTSHHTVDISHSTGIVKLFLLEFICLTFHMVIVNHYKLLEFWSAPHLIFCFFSHVLFNIFKSKY